LVITSWSLGGSSVQDDGATGALLKWREHHGGVFPLKGGRPVAHSEHDAEREQVGAAIEVLSARLFGRHGDGAQGETFCVSWFDRATVLASRS
jgi:hypothetical protein